MPAPRLWTEDAIVAAIQAFYACTNQWPVRADFLTQAHGLPHLTTITRRCRTWQDPIRHAQALEKERHAPLQ